MLTSQDFWAQLKSQDIKFFSGVPCSILRNILTELANHPEVTYIPAVREDAALGVASGAYLTGRSSGILIQNSGLNNIINGLTSFNLIYKIPILMFITWRGYQGKDAPEHSIMGEKTLPLLDLINIPYKVISENNFKESLQFCVDYMIVQKLPVALVLKKGVVE
jgi:sulfopyruvate decarboxylase subunit alpha